jgi:hypothetical protein
MGESSQSSTSLSPTTSPSSVPSPALSTLSLTDLKEVPDKDKQEAARLKTDANKAFQGHDFTRAAQLYSEAIKHNPGDATLFCNRAYTRIKLEEHGYALHDAACAIELNPKYAKAYYRCVSATPVCLGDTPLSCSHAVTVSQSRDVPHTDPQAAACRCRLEEGARSGAAKCAGP